MELTVNARNVTLTPELKNYVERKLGQFDSKLDNIMETRIEILEEPTRSSLDRTVIRVNISGANVTLHTEERADSVLTAVDRAFDSINKQIEKQKGKWQGKDKGGQSIREESSRGFARRQPQAHRPDDQYGNQADVALRSPGPGGPA